MVMSFNIPFLQMQITGSFRGFRLSAFYFKWMFNKRHKRIQIYIIKSLLESVSQVAYNKDKGKELFKWNH